MSRVLVKPGVLFSTIAPAGFRLLSAIEAAARALPFDLTITSACDGEHSGPEDPHHSGNAYDIRTHDVEDKGALLGSIMRNLGPGEPQASSGGFVTAQFFGWLEQAGTENEHIHIQLRHGQEY